MNKLRKKLITETETIEAYANNCYSICSSNCYYPCSAHTFAAASALENSSYYQYNK
ncbi:putative bacteriocin precursor, CLI_3235 family [Clostridium sp. BNL1100]|nr:putative bacteriocin precursor, CLI_3235 family [Clostridium sp. BNL1100]